MLLSWIWTGLAGISIFCAVLMNNGGALASAVTEGAQSGVTLAISIAGSVCLWTGVGKVMERAGLTRWLSVLLSPLLRRMFPATRKDKVAEHYLTGNICANLLGLGNAATPMGIQAARRLADPNRPGIATDELCRLVVLNTASIQLIPANVAAVRAGLGSAAPFDILPAVWVTSLCSAALGILAAFVMGAMRKNA